MRARMPKWLWFNASVHEERRRAVFKGVSEQTTFFAMVTAYRCGATALSLSAGTDRDWTGFAPSPS